MMAWPSHLAHDWVPQSGTAYVEDLLTPWSCGWRGKSATLYIALYVLPGDSLCA